MEAKELRIGNITKNGVVKGVIDTRVFIGKLALHATNIEPIEITEEILLKCGFKKNGLYYTFNDFDVDLKGWFGYDNFTNNANIKHLHQLQNLYYALTGNELEVCLA